MNVLLGSLNDCRAAARRTAVRAVVKLALAVSDREGRQAAARRAARAEAQRILAQAALGDSAWHQQRPVLRLIQGGLR